MKLIDCDANATYAPDDDILDLFREALSCLSNPSSMHRAGQRAKSAIEKARAELLEAVCAHQDDTVVFTSGATESNNMLPGLLPSATSQVVVHSFEHPCVLATFKRHEERSPGTVTVLTPDSSGRISIDSVVRSLSAKTKLVSLMGANNETGALYPLAELCQAVKAAFPHVLVHCDAAQMLGKERLSFAELEVDAMTLSGHKIGALPGVGALVLRKGLHIDPIIVGGSQEMKLRGGTENVPAICIFSEVAKRVVSSLATRVQSMRAARDAFESELSSRCKRVSINFVDLPRLPNTSSVLVDGVRGDDLVVALDLAKVLASTGAACSSGKREPSHVLLAHGFTEQEAASSVRFSFRADASADDGREVATRFIEVIERFTKSEAA